MTDSPLLLDPRLIEKARAADIVALAERVGARLKHVRATEWKWAGPCPACGGTDRFSLNKERGIFNCRGFGGGDAIAMVRHALGLNFVEAVEFITGEECVTVPSAGTVSDKPANLPTSDDERRARDLKSAKSIASGVCPLLGTPGEAYLRKTRCIDTATIQDILARADAIGWHGAVYLNEPAHALHGQRLGCIVGIMTDPVSGRPTGAISRTYIGPDLSKVCKAKTLGAPMGAIATFSRRRRSVRLALGRRDRDRIGRLSARSAASVGARERWHYRRLPRPVGRRMSDDPRRAGRGKRQGDRSLRQPLA
jgi:hypothetical protein